MPNSDPVAVIGMACRLPGGIDSPEQLWEALQRGDDLVTEIPADRWDADEYYDPEPGVPGRSVSRWGAFIDDVAGFDAEFFGMSEPEATAIDPQHRLLLETSWDALEHAGLNPSTVTGSLAGVFMGLTHVDYALLAADAHSVEGPYGFTGTNFSMASGRIAYALGVHGPALTVDTADTLGLLDILVEDGDYGVFTFPTGDTGRDGADKLVSRDLLDSVSELLFLDRALQISRRRSLTVLDIGAGYGRLAYHAARAFDNIDTYYCIDAVPESTFVSSYYLAKKGATRARVIPFDDQAELDAGTIDLAVNIHSFSECAIEAVDYWVSRCAKLGIEHLFIVPDRSAQGGQALRLVNGTDFTPLVGRYGYELSHAEPKYLNPEVQKFGVSPAWYYLFRAV